MPPKTRCGTVLESIREVPDRYIEGHEGLLVERVLDLDVRPPHLIVDKDRTRPPRNRKAASDAGHVLSEEAEEGRNETQQCLLS